MQNPELPSNENQRLQELLTYQVLDTDDEVEFNFLVELASQICGTKIALISLIDSHRQWFKAKIGLEQNSTPRQLAFCAHAILNPNEPLIIQDAREDDRFKENPLVHGEPHVVFYAGIPLVTPSGHALGTLCAIDDKPRELSAQQLHGLRQLSRQVMHLLELRRLKIELEHKLAIEKKFKVLVEQGSDGVLIVSRSGLITYCSAGMTKITGLENQLLVKKHIHNFIHPLDERLRLVLNPAIRSNSKLNKGTFSVRFKTKTNDWLWTEATLTNMLEDVHVNGWLIVFRDISERVKSEQLIRSSEKRFKALVEEGSDLTAVINQDFYLTYISANYPEALQYKSHEIIGNKLNEYIHPDDEPKFSSELKNCLSKRRVLFTPFRIQRKSGNWIWLKAIGTNLLNDPDVNGVVINSSDITQLKTAEQQLLFSNERYKIINSITEDVIYEHHTATDLVQFSARIEQFGIRLPSPCTFEDYVHYIHPEDRPGLLDNYNKFVESSGNVCTSSEYRIVNDAGNTYYIYEAARMLMNPDGTPVKIIGLIRDVTKSKIEFLKNEISKEIVQFFAKHQQLDDAILNTLQHLGTKGNYDITELWMVSPDKSKIYFSQSIAHTKAGEQFYAASQQYKVMGKGEGLPGTIWQNSKIALWDGLGNNTSCLRREAAEKSRIDKSVGLPLIVANEVIGVIILGRQKSSSIQIEHYEILQEIQKVLGAEISRKKQTELMDLLFQFSPDFMAIAANNGKFWKVNPAMVNTLGYTEEELTTLPFEHFIHKEDLTTTINEFDENINNVRQANNFINRYITKTGELRWISWNSSPVFGQDGMMFAYGRDITELYRKEELLQHAGAMARIGSWEINYMNQEIYWSIVTNQLHHRSDLYKPLWNDVLVEYGNQTFYQFIESCLTNSETGNQAFDVEVPLKLENNNLFWVRILGRVHYGEGNNKIIQGSIQDIHIRKTAELNLLKVINEKNILLESIGDGFISVNKNWQIKYCNRHAELLTGIQRDRTLNKNLWLFIPEAVREIWQQKCSEAILNNIFTSFEYHLSENNQWLEVSVHPQENNLSIFIKDITERKHDLEQLRVSNELFNQVTRATNDIIWDCDFIENKISWSGNINNLHLNPIDQNSDAINSWFNIIHHDDQPEIRRNFNDILEQSDIDKWTADYRIVTDGNITAYVFMRSLIIRNTLGKVVRVVSNLTDITYRKEYEYSLRELNQQLQDYTRALELSNEELEQFAFIASHDLQEPLRMISSFMSLLELKYKNTLDEQALSYIRYATDGAHRMKKIILDLLEYSRAGKVNGERKLINLQDVIDNFCTLRRQLIQEKQATITVDCSTTIMSYDVPIVQIISNLLDNALKYAQPGRPLQVLVSCSITEDNFWKVSITDNGIGIDKQYFDKIFVIFQRLHNRKEISGTGLGLAIVKKTVESLGGTISVSSQPGIGSTFEFAIPIN